MPGAWYNLESQTDDAVFGGEKSAFDALGLTRTQRLGGFVLCLVGGFGISLLGGILLFVGAAGAFATLFALGTIISLIGTGFLVGFKKQLKTMFKPVRVVATILLIASVALCFVGAFVLPAVTCIVFVILQYLAYLWYSLSYIPYARAAVKSAFGFK